MMSDFNQQHRPFLAQLAAAGFPPESIDLVVCTHLHVDHVGWNTRLVNGEWIPTFPRARYLLGAVLAAAATTDALVLGTHFAGTTAGRILSTDQSYRFVPQP
jgi:glyoxylase-like metal-dependent hydrolase (beta-lactamase superfamily II)